MPNLVFIPLIFGVVFISVDDVPVTILCLFKPQFSLKSWMTVLVLGPLSLRAFQWRSKKGEFAYRAHQATSREVDVGRGKTKEGRLGEHIFGHLVAEQPSRRLLGPADYRVELTPKPVHVLHHIAL